MLDFQECPRIDQETGTPLLTCPRCGGDHVAPSGIVVRHRDHADAPGLVVGVREHAVSVRHTEVNPNDGREDSVDIAFVCKKGCGGSFVLRFQEDAGRTAVEWDELPRARASIPA